MTNFTPNPSSSTPAELAQRAYMAGHTELAAAYERIAELEGICESLEDHINDTLTLEDWEQNNGPANDYRDFFYACFDRLPAHYPAPSVTSDYDQSIIFDAIDPPV
jgi:hypothetical protein